MPKKTAGSSPSRLPIMGIRAPMEELKATTAITAAATVSPKLLGPPRVAARIKVMTAKARPRAKPRSISLPITFRVSLVVISPMAIALITRVEVWAPALPPVPMSRGMKKERATMLVSILS